jgi:hypothetical protein
MNFAQPQYQNSWNSQTQGYSYPDSFLSFENTPSTSIPYQYSNELSHKVMNFHASKPQLTAQRPANSLTDSENWSIASQNSSQASQSNADGPLTLEQKTNFLDQLIAQQTKAIIQKTSQEDQHVPFWRSQEGQDLLESAGINGEPWWEEPRQPVHPGLHREPNDVDFMMQSTRKMLKREMSDSSQHFQNVFKYPTIENHELIKQGLLCQNNPSFESALLSTDESEQSQLTGSPRDHADQLANFISKSNTPSERGGVPRKKAPKGAKTYFPGMIIGRVRGSVKDFLERYQNKLSESERMRFKYIYDILTTGILRTEGDKKEFMNFLKSLKSMQTFDSIEESFRSARPYAIILLKFVYSFLSTEGSIDMEDWFSHGRINNDNQGIIRDNKDWYKSEFQRIGQRLLA